MSGLVVLDTNILVPYLLPSKNISALKIVVSEVLRGCATPVYSDETVAEYEEVLSRPKFGFSNSKVRSLLNSIFEKGLYVVPLPTSLPFIDSSDRCFYETAVAARTAWLITGNKRHFPNEAFIVTPAEYLRLMQDY